MNFKWDKIYTTLCVIVILLVNLSSLYSYDKVIVKQPEFKALKESTVTKAKFEIAMQQVNEQTL
jgi:hypothetical protein